MTRLRRGGRVHSVEGKGDLKHKGCLTRGNVFEKAYVSRHRYSGKSRGVGSSFRGTVTCWEVPEPAMLRTPKTELAEEWNVRCGCSTLRKNCETRCWLEARVLNEQLSSDLITVLQFRSQQNVRPILESSSFLQHSISLDEFAS